MVPLQSVVRPTPPERERSGYELEGHLGLDSLCRTLVPGRRAVPAPGGWVERQQHTRGRPPSSEAHERKV